MPARTCPIRPALLFALSCTATAQIAVLQIRVVEGDGAVHAPGARAFRPLTVEVKDDAGRPVERAAVTFHLPEEGPGGVFPSGLRTAVVPTDARGRASLAGLRVNRIPGSFQIRIYASKEQARAGVVSLQYVAAPNTGIAKARTGSWRKWMTALAIVAGGAVAGSLAATRSAAAGIPAPDPAPAITIGTPTVVVVTP